MSTTRLPLTPVEGRGQGRGAACHWRGVCQTRKRPIWLGTRDCCAAEIPGRWERGE